MTPAGTSNELDVQNGWEENTHTHIMIRIYRCTLNLIGGSIGRTSFSNPTLYILSFTLSKSSTSRLCTSLICLLFTAFTPAKFVLRFLRETVTGVQSLCLQEDYWKSIFLRSKTVFFVIFPYQSRQFLFCCSTEQYFSTCYNPFYFSL